MGFLDRLLGREPRDRGYGAAPEQTSGYPSQGYAPDKPGYGTYPGEQPGGRPAQSTLPGTAKGRSADDVAIDRYRYLLRTAPPDAVEQAHAEAFAQLSAEQRQRVLAELGAAVPPQERATSDDPRSLARMATRAELRSPGTLERAFGGAPGGSAGPSFGSMVGSSLLGTVAGVVIGSAVADMLFGPAFGDPAQDFADEDGGTPDGGSSDGGDDAGSADTHAVDYGTDAGSADVGSADPGGGFFDGGDGGWGGDFGGDFGGGGGDF
jgi:hypothetical protein